MCQSGLLGKISLEILIIRFFSKCVFKIIFTIHMWNFKSWEIFSVVLGKKAGDYKNYLGFANLVSP